MFGYVLANKTELTEEELARYKSCYCGLCHTIKERGNALERIALTYDMTFLILLLSSLYEPEETGGEATCIAHPFRKHHWTRSEIAEYAADMNVFLAYYNALDDLEDEGSLKGRAGAALFREHASRIERLYPRQSKAIRDALARMGELEKANEEPMRKADLLANSFGALMGELFVLREDRWEPNLRKMAEALGRFIYMADAFTDLERDVKKGSYNPLLAMRGEKAEGESDDLYFDSFTNPTRAILTIHIAEAAEEFEKLPLEQDLAILRNILYSGVWARVDFAAEERRKRVQKAMEKRTENETNEPGKEQDHNESV